MLIAARGWLNAEEWRLPVGFMLLVAAAICQLPGWISLAEYLDGVGRPSAEVGWGWCCQGA
jgi:hypothetical protein